MPKGYPPEFRRKVPDLLKAGRSVAELVRDLQISDQSIYNWRRQELIDTGPLPGITSTDQAELVAARRRIAELETNLRSTGGPTSCSRRRCPQKAGTRSSRRWPWKGCRLRCAAASSMSPRRGTTRGCPGHPRPGRCATCG